VERAEAEAILDGDREAAVALLMRIGVLVEAYRRLEARVAELERRLERSSGDSSLPPSRDPPSAPPRLRRQGSGRERGGQPGHEGKNRPLLALERPARLRRPLVRNGLSDHNVAMRLPPHVNRGQAPPVRQLVEFPLEHVPPYSSFGKS
jgi:hypothetical protein